MAKKEETLQEYVEKIDYREYTDDELKHFHNLIQRFWFERQMSTGEKVKVFEKKSLLLAYGAIGKEGGIVLENIIRSDKTGSIISYKRPTRMEQFENLWSQYENWQYRNGLVGNTAIHFKIKNFELEADQHGKKNYLWICPKCQKFEGTTDELNEHAKSCPGAIEEVETVNDEIPF